MLYIKAYAANMAGAWFKHRPVHGLYRPTRRTFLCKDNELILQLYKSLVRPRLEYCIQAWRPYLKEDINVLERVQKRATKLISGLSEMGYEERLKILGLTMLETRRLKGDLIEIFKILKGYENIDQEVFLICHSPAFVVIH